MVMKKRGIVLMMTLILITVIMGIATVIMMNSERLLRLGNIGFSQSATLRIVNDLEQQLPSLLRAITGAEELDLAMRLPLQLESKKGDFILKASLSSPYNRLNINALMGSNGIINISKLSIFLKLFSLYPIADPDIFFKLVFDTLDMDRMELSSGTEIAQSQPDFVNGLIANEAHFNQILSQYIMLTGDTSILSIPWNEYIGYEGEKMDFNAINAQTLSLILPNIALEKVRALTLYRTKAFVSKEEVIAAEPTLASIFDTYFFIYQSKASYNLVCDLHISQNFREEHLKFNYNLLDKKVKNVKFL